MRKKELIEFIKETRRRLWVLENPPKFQYGDSVQLTDPDIKSTYTYKGVKEVEVRSYGQNPLTDIVFVRHVYIDNGTLINFCPEHWLMKINKDS